MPVAAKIRRAAFLFERIRFAVAFSWRTSVRAPFELARLRMVSFTWASCHESGVSQYVLCRVSNDVLDLVRGLVVRLNCGLTEDIKPVCRSSLLV
jgi:hypothetical protein